MIFGLFRRSGNQRVIDRLHGEIVAAARDPVLFTTLGIEDSFEGRFEALTLYAALVLRRLNVMPAPAPSVAQDLADEVFRQFEVALREMGVGDTSVPKRMNKLAEAFLGRSAAYDEALRGDRGTLAATLARNVYADRQNAVQLADHVAQVEAALAETPLEVFLAGPVPFPKPPAISRSLE